MTASRLAAVVALAFGAATCGGDSSSTATLSPSSPTLLQCPSAQTQTKSALITTRGATLRIGGTSVQTPGGALLTATTITLTVPASQYVEIAVQANDLTSFLLQWGARLASLLHSFQSAATRAKLPNGVRPYDLRHTAVTRWVERYPSAFAQKPAGHASFKTTERYIHLSDEALDVVVERTKPNEKAG